MMRRLAAVTVFVVAACGSQASSKEPTGAEPGKPIAMTAQDTSTTTGGCAGASPALLAALHQPIASLILPDGAGRQALTRLAVKPETLHAIGLDASCPNQVRFAAFEGWIALAGEAMLGSVDDATAAAMAAVQAEAIRTAEDAGLWGLPPDVTSSEVSRHLIVLGRRVLPRLRPLLDDTREAPYTGGEIHCP